MTCNTTNFSTASKYKANLRYFELKPTLRTVPNGITAVVYVRHVICQREKEKESSVNQVFVMNNLSRRLITQTRLINNTATFGVLTHCMTEIL